MVFGQIPAPPAAVGNSSVPLVPGAYRSQQQTNKNQQQPNLHLILLEIVFLCVVF